MPLPKRSPKEDKQKFVSRCMGDETMKKDFPKTSQRIAVCLSQTRTKDKANLIEEVHDQLFANNYMWNDEWDEFVWDIEIDQVVDEYEEDRLVSSKKDKKMLH